MESKSRMALVAAIAWGLAAGGAMADGMSGANGAVMNDLEIAHSAYTAGAIDIRYAHLALAISDAPPIRDFARTMIRDHAAVNEAAEALVEQLGVIPVDNPLSQELDAGAAAKRAELQSLTGAAFDCAYAKNELGYHQIVNQTVEEQFIPTATVPELKVLLAEALATFKVHEQHAAHMVGDLDCG